MLREAAHPDPEPLFHPGARRSRCVRQGGEPRRRCPHHGTWCAIGSSNFDDRSFETNDEITIGFHDGALARRLEEIFAADSRRCVELTAEGWKKRGLWHRVQDSALYLFNEVL